jgi:hypothetical protein
MVPDLIRRDVLTGVSGVLALTGGCLGAGEQTTNDGGQTPTCPESDDTAMVSCATDHPKIDVRPTIAPLKSGATNQRFVLRNRTRKSVTLNTAGVRIFRWEADSWKELGNEKPNMTGSPVHPGDAFYWKVKFSQSRNDVLVRDAEVVFPESETGRYAATVTVEDEDGNDLRCGTLFEIE